MSARHMGAAPVHTEWRNLRLDRPSAYAAWDAARDEAATALAGWCRRRSADAYALYRAAQDREDAAQDALARTRWPSSPASSARIGAGSSNTSCHV